MIRKLSLFVCLLFAFSVVVAPAAYAKKGKLVDSDEYKDDDFEKGCIEDYSDMVEGDGVEWTYVTPGVKLKDFSYDVNWKNKSDVGAKSMMRAVEENWDEMASDRLGGKKGTLTGEGCVDYVVTDLALLHFVDGRFVLEEVAPGFTAQEVMALAEMDMVPAEKVGVMA